MAHQDPWIYRLQKEYELMETFCANSSNVSFEVIEQTHGLPPVEYLVTYRLRSIIGVDQQQVPQFGDRHIMRISIPTSYPLLTGPICRMESTIWHPNIRHTGVHKGRICLNTPAMGFWHTLDMLVTHVGDMLQYRNYHALPITPFPEDMTVAKWVREVGEPQGYVNKALGIYTDSQPFAKTNFISAQQNHQHTSPDIKIVRHAR